MSQACRLDNLGIDAAMSRSEDALRRVQVLRQTSPNLGDFQYMRQPIMEQMPLGGRDHLRDTCQSSKLIRIDDAIPISLRAGSLVQALPSFFDLSAKPKGVFRLTYGHSQATPTQTEV